MFRAGSVANGLAAEPLALQRSIAAYLGLAIGDALGATVEFMTPAEIRHAYGVHRDISGGGWLRLQAGDITDDTEMSLALGNAILNTGKVEPVSIATAFSEWMRGKPKDIGNTVRRGIVQFRRTGCTAIPESEHDAGNGACMRCLPVAIATLHASLPEVVAASRLQAHITHHNPLSDAGTECIVRMVQAAIPGEPLTELELLAQELVQQFPPFEYRKTRRDNPSGYIVDTLQAVFQALFATDSLEAALVDVVNRGGDADTTGAILGMVAGAHYGLDAIPARWLQKLDNGIRLHCIEQARSLYQLATQGPSP